MSRKRSHKHREHAAPQKPSPRRIAPPPSRDERVLRQRILKFTYQHRFKTDFESAIRLYFGEEALQDNVLTVDEEEIPGFQEWYIHDYVTSEGKRIIALFVEDVGPQLPSAQQRMLDDWLRTNRYRLLEVQAIEPGVGVTVQDLLGGEVLEVNDISSSYDLVKWQVILMRTLLTEGRLHFTGSGTPLPPSAKSELLDFARELWKEYQAERPRASLDDFHRDHGLDLYHRAVEIATTPPPIYTPEGHSVVASTARYAVTDPRAAEERLDEAEEFFYAGPADEDETALAYVWVLAGRSLVPERSVEGKGLIMSTDFVLEEPGTPSYRSLGDVQLWRDRLELICLSRERLKAGKTLLKQVLGRLVRHLGDEFRDVDSLLESSETPSPAPRREPLSEVEEAISHQMMIDQYRKWLDESIPALGGKSPRQAASDPAMHEQLEQLLKSIEYMEERRRREDGLYIDVADIRHELGLPPR